MSVVEIDLKSNTVTEHLHDGTAVVAPLGGEEKPAMRGLADLGQYGQMTPEEAWEGYNWGSNLATGSTVYRYAEERLTVMVGMDSDGVWWCEVEAKDGEGEYDSCWEMVGQGWGDTAEEAVLLSIVDMVGMDVMRREGNCEDSVNLMADEAYELAYGPAPYSERDAEKTGRVLGAARRYTEESCYRAGFEWEEF